MMNLTTKEYCTYLLELDIILQEDYNNENKNFDETENDYFLDYDDYGY